MSCIVQVGKGSDDHAFWGRPEDMLMERPAYKIDREHPGKIFLLKSKWIYTKIYIQVFILASEQTVIFTS